MRFIEGIFRDVASMVEKASLKAMLVVREAELKVLNDQLDKLVAEIAALNGKQQRTERGIREVLKLRHDTDLAFSKLRELLGE